MKKIKLFVIGGIVLCTLVLLGEVILLKTCTTNLACVGINMLLLVPNTVFINVTKINLSPMGYLFVSFIFYFLVGGTANLIIEKIRGKNK